MTELRLAGRPTYVGARVDRVEDDRLLTGRGAYVADIYLENTADVAFVRSSLAHAGITGVSLETARANDGVVAVVSAADLNDVSPFPDFITYMRGVKAFPLCRERARYVGAPIAAVVAEDRYQAEDAAELIEVDYEELPAVAGIESALGPDAPLLFDDWPNNKIVDIPSLKPEIDEIFSRHHVVRGTYSIQRHSGVPIETRGCIAEFRQGRLTLWTATQSPHIVRTTLSYVLPIAERDIRVVAPDVGGGFGTKCHVYPEEVVVAWLAMRLGRPIRWIEDRAEHLVATNHAREHVIELEGAVDEEGRIVALRSHILHNVGSAEIFMAGICPTFVLAAHLTGPYKIDVVENSITQVVTNKTPSGAFRGFGIPEAVFALERFVEKAAREVGVDPLDARRRMLLDQEDLPYLTATGAQLDSGSFKESFERVVELGTAAEARARERYRDDPHARVGVGYAAYIEGTAPTYFGTTGHWTSYDSATIRVDPDGSVVASVGVTTAGQGVTTMVATLTADALGVPVEDVRVQIGDTDVCPYGLGGWGSRSTVVGGGAILKAAGQVREKVLRIAAHLLEAAPEDLEIGAGKIHVRGSEESHVSMADVGTAATVRTVDLPPDMEPGLEATATYDPPGLQHWPDENGLMNGAAAWANATHATVVKVDIETGEIEILDYLVAHDCGPLINPTIVEGQVVGGVAHGIGGTLYEDMVYTPEGQPLAVTFMDYLIPTATEIPFMVVEHFESPSPNMPLGVKGVGEGGTIGPPAAIANAVANALVEFDVDITATPLTPGVVRGMILSATAHARAG